MKIGKRSIADCKKHSGPFRPMTDVGSAGLLWRTPPWAARVASGKYSQAPISDRFGAFRPAALRAWSAGNAPKAPFEADVTGGCRGPQTDRPQ